MRFWVRSLPLLSFLSICRCRELWCWLQTWLGSCIFVALVSAGGYISDWTPNLGIPHAAGVAHKHQKDNNFFRSPTMFMQHSAQPADMDRNSMSVERWFDSEENVYIHNGMLLPQKKAKIQRNKKKKTKKKNLREPQPNAICTHVVGNGNIHPTWITSEHERQTPRDIPSIRNLTSETNEPFCIIETQGLENLFVIARLWGRLWEGLRFMSDRVKLLCFVCVSNEILFYGLHLVTYAENKLKTVWE